VCFLLQVSFYLRYAAKSVTEEVGSDTAAAAALGLGIMVFNSRTCDEWENELEKLINLEIFVI